MVALATQPPLPSLTAEDKHLLRRYFALNQSVEALAAELSSSCSPSLREGAGGREQSAAPFTSSSALVSPHSSLPTDHSPPPDEFDLAAWTLSDAIAPHIAYRRAEIQRARQERSLQTLDSVLESESPIERRRAATTILRTYANQLQRRSPCKDAARSSEPSGASRRSIPDATPSAPPIRPSPDLAESDIIGAIVEAVLSPDHQSAQAAPSELFAENAQIDNNPAQDVELSSFCPKAEIFSESRDDHVRHTPGPPETRTSITYIHSEDDQQLTLRITLSRSPSGPHPNCWLISRIDVNKDQDPQYRRNSS